ncbi:PQQ-binding-like beta-propeller repeat protein [Streptomyces sp. NPDC006458]|uniref:outer membrane protein assembly factor BamB family protein n=1 Tax=Streptomyces sp. NPDC006458 TaxID=3154302 RepID=UPI0033B3AAFF
MSFGPPPSIYTQSALTAEQQQSKRRRKRVLGGLSVVLALVLGVGGWLWWGSGGDPGPDDPKAPAAAGGGRLDVRETVEKRPANQRGVMGFRFSADDMAPGERHEMPGTWATDKILAKGINRSLIGFRIGKDVAVGDEEWKLRLDGPICGVTRDVTGENRTAVLSRESEDASALCNQVVFVDLDDGRKVWQREVPVSKLGTGKGSPKESGGGQDTPGVALAHGTVAVTWGGGTDAYSMDTGKTRWSVESDSADKCEHHGAAGGIGLVVRLQCWTGDTYDGLTYKVRGLDPDTGATRWTYKVDAGIQDVRVLSTEPPVLAVAAADIGITHILALDEKGKHRTTITLATDAYVAECADETDLLATDDCPTVVVGDGQVFLTTSEQGDTIHNYNWIVGFDLRTGRTTEKFESGRNALLHPLRMSGDKLLALRDSSDHITPMGLVALDPRTGEESTYLYFDLPTEGWTLTSTELAHIIVEHGRVFFAARSASAPDNGDGSKSWVWLTVGIEPDAARKR